MQLGEYIANKRKGMGLTQQQLANMLSISFQAVSRWENGTSYPDIDLLPRLADIFGSTIDNLLGYNSSKITKYDDRYKTEGYYWGLVPNQICYDIMRLMPPVKPYHILDIGCGEGKDAVFFAKNGYRVSAFDIADTGLEKARRLAEQNNVEVNFFKGNVLDFNRDAENFDSFDIIYSSGVFHYVPKEMRESLTKKLKSLTAKGGLNVLNVFTEKPFINHADDEEIERHYWLTGELFMYYHDWFFHKTEEFIFDCSSGGTPHKHCMNVMIAEKI